MTMAPDPAVSHLDDLPTWLIIQASAHTYGARPNPNDRRRDVVTITPSGERRLAALDAVLAAVQDELLASLSSAERTVFVEPLPRILRTAPTR